MIKEGLGTALTNIAKTAGNAVIQDVIKDSGPIEKAVHAFLDGLKNHPEKYKVISKKIIITVDKYKKVIPDYETKRKHHEQLKKITLQKDVDYVIEYLNKGSLNEHLFAFYRWFYYLTVYIERNTKDKAVELIIIDILLDIPNKDSMTSAQERQLENIIEVEVVKKVETNKAAFDNQVKTVRIKETTMPSFKNFMEEEKRKEEQLKEDGLQAAQANADNQGKQALNADAKAAQADAKSLQAQAKVATMSAQTKQKQARMEEGVYAGGDGKNKKIPFTQNPTNQPQAVGPNKKAKSDLKDEDREEEATEEREKTLAELTKELQDLADEACDIAMNNIDPTEGTAIEKMAAKEEFSLKESKGQWERLEARWAKNPLKEACIGGVCGLGEPAEGGSENGVGKWGVKPMPAIGELSMPRNSQVPQVADRSTIYSFIKDNQLDKSKRDFALNKLTDTFGNASTELSQILSDAILSDGEPEDISKSYDYSGTSVDSGKEPVPDEAEIDIEVGDDVPHEGEMTQMKGLKDAWATMENNELKDL